MEITISAILFFIRVFLPFLAIFIVICCFKSMKTKQRGKRPLIVLFNKITGEEIPIIYWENSIGRNRSCDVIIKDPTVSREHAVLFRRLKGWMISDTGSKSGIIINGEKVSGKVQVYIDDVITLGATSYILRKASDTSVAHKIVDPSLKSKPIRSASLLFLVSFFHFLVAIQPILLSNTPTITKLFPLASVILISWVFFFISFFILRRVTFEIEALALFLSGTGILLISNYNIKEVYTQLAALLIGLFVYCLIIWFIEKLDTVMKFRVAIAAFAIILFAVNLLLAKEVHGSRNWVVLGPVSIQPSELVKIAFVFVGASTLDSLQTTKNLTGFIAFSAICIGSLFLMKDFGTACVFFVAFLIISFMRSGSIRTIVLSCAAAAIGAFMILTFKPYIKDRFAIWGHVWDFPQDAGYQQTRVLSYASSGGLLGVGVGNGKLKSIFAATSDLIFGVVCEELGLIIALTMAVLIAGLAIYARSQSNKSRSSFYSISACAAAGMLVFQTGLHIFGSTDILPLTGVTFPLVSLGGTSLVSVFGLLAFIKAADERTYSIRR
ncbi:MAG: Peptidoglycan glycosyltransferase MrdB [Eubacteriales bacterium SKADARSKE-1]|nr:Peptidoglycan glycosyltransferase MrdB [Eubacteriales bacterium SKADARSKE-1]